MRPLSLVVAVAENGVIGRDNDLPWHLRADLRRFRALTWGRPIVMGRRAWDAIGHPLPGRDSVVLSRQPGFEAPGATVVRGWEEATEVADTLADASGAPEIAVIGGAEIYRLALPDAEWLHLTLVHALPEGDVLFPPWDEAAFAETAREERPAGPEDDHATTYRALRRVRDAAGR